MMQHERGQAAYIIVLFLAILMLIPTAMKMAKTSSQDAAFQLHYTAQANNVARAGLIDAIAWFRRQPTQPVRSSANPLLYLYPDAAFAPQESTDTVTTDTLDDTIGIVKEYALTDDNRLWARYEIRRQQNPLLNPINAQAVHDITDRRIDGRTAGEGLAWYIESKGYVYRRKDSSVAYNQSPNQIVGRARVATEIRRLALTLPINAAVLVNNRTSVTARDNGRIRGGTSVGLGYYSGGSGPTVTGSGSEISGTPNRVDIDGVLASGTLNTNTVFGVNANDIKLMADFSVSSAAELPSSYPKMSVVYIATSATFDDTHQLRGGGVLYVNGNLTISQTSNTIFSGIIYVNGNVVVEGPALISGALLATGTVTIDGAGDVAQISYDATIISSVRQQLCQYRENRSAYYTFTGSDL